MRRTNRRRSDDGGPRRPARASEIGADRGLRQGRIRFRRHVASGLAIVPARCDLGLACQQSGRYRQDSAGAGVRRGRLDRYADHRHRHRCLAAAAGTSRGVTRGEGGAGCDADRSGRSYLQHHDRRAAARRRRTDRGAMSGADDGRPSADFCADLVRTHDFARYASTLFTPAEQRRALWALYAFNVEISRVREQVSQPLPGEMRLQWWTDMLSGTGHGGIEGNPVAAELLLAIRSFRLPVERLKRLIEEHQFDLYNDPMPSMAALEGYINDTSSALLSLGARFAGWQSDETEHLARHAGLAQGIVQVMVSLPLDASQRRLFVPQQMLTKHGCDPEDIFAGKQTPKLRDALGDVLNEAQTHLNA